MDKEAWKARWLSPKAKAQVEPLPHGGYVLGEELAARSTRNIEAAYPGMLLSRRPAPDPFPF